MAAGDEKKGGKKEPEKKEAEAPAETAPASKAGNRMIFIAIGSAIAILLVVVVVVLLTRSGGQKKVEEVEVVPHDAPIAVDEAADELEEEEEAIGAIFPLESFIVNLKGGGFLRAQVQFEFVERDISPRFHVRQAIVRDGMISLFAGKSAEEISTQEGRDKLKAEIKDLVNEVMKKQEIKRVYFTQFVVQ